MSRLNVFGNAFLDGFTGAGILGGLRIPGDPEMLFEQPADERVEIRIIPKAGYPLSPAQMLVLYRIIQEVASRESHGQVQVIGPEHVGPEHAGSEHVGS